MTGDISRRGALTLGLGLTTSLAMPSILRAQPRSIVVATTGGATQDALTQSLFEPFTAQTGISIIPTSVAYAKVKAMVDAGAVEWDVFLADGAITAAFGAQGLLEKIDYGVVNRAPLLEGRSSDFSVQNEVSAAVIGWNTNAVSVDLRPHSWSDFWDLERIPGQRGLWQQPFQTFEIALLADGVSREELYPLDVDRAFQSLDKLRDRLYWWTAGAQGTQLLVSGEVPMSKGWNGRLHDPKETGAPIDFTFEDAILNGNGWGVVKGAPNVRTSMEFIAFAMEARQQAEYSSRIPYGPINLEALDLLSEDRLRVIPSSPENSSATVFQNYDWWAENGQAISEKFNNWLLS